MPIPVVCGGCGKCFKAPDRGAGKKVPCPTCKTTISIPAAPPVPDDDEYRLVEEPRPAPSAEAAPAKGGPSGTAAAVVAKPTWVPPTKRSTPTWLRHLHWCLALAMIPLAVSIFVPDKSEEQATAQTSNEPTSVSSSPVDSGKSPGRVTGQPAPGGPEKSDDDKAQVREILDHMSLDDLLGALPGHKLPRALLARDTYLHWLFALFTAAAYMTVLIVLASDKSAQALHLLGLGLFTATGGIVLLFVVQMLSTIGVVRVGGVIGLALLILLLIGLSYSVALSPDSGLITSFIGFTCGVGLCEEVCKALPILVYYRIGNQQSWRGAFLWGLASGTGFGVSEAIMYSQDFYNGIAGPGIYVVRFVSCVALHAIWAGSIGISINQRQYLLQEDHEEWWMYALAVLRIIAIPMVLHGLYDTLLKKDLDFLALLAAAASFGYLAWQISHLRGSDDEDERAAYVAKYIRSKAAAQGG
jgi:protease PrsW